MKHYAVLWPYGVATNGNTGRPFRNVYRFSSRALRDAWVDAGQPHRTGSFYRESATRAEVDSELRRADTFWVGCEDTPGAELLY